VTTLANPLQFSASHDASARESTGAAVDNHLLHQAMEKAKACLLSRQNQAGYWCAELQGDSILQSEYILLKYILGQESDPDLRLMGNELRATQNPDGGWSLYPGGPADISGTVKAYFCLKLLGDSPDAPHMKKCRELVHARGGAEKCNTFTRFYFACLGQIPFSACPAIPPEIVFLPRWFYFNLYNVSAWTRTMILPLGMVTTFQQVRQLPREVGISELYLDHAAASRLDAPPGSGAWGKFFVFVDRLLKLYNKFPVKPFRKLAIKKAEQWIIDHLSGSEGLGAIFPPMVYLLIVYKLLGYPDDHPRVLKSHQELRDFYIREPEGRKDSIRLQPCFSPVWDTGIAMHALAEAGLSPDSDSAKRGVQWLLSKECRVASDWAIKARKTDRQGNPLQPSGWFFEFENAHYPDTDDTAMTINSLYRLGVEGGNADAKAACQRGVEWLFAMQNDDGGWAAFDRTKDRPILEKIPFADHNAMQDPSCPDITGRVIEGLGRNGLKVPDPNIRRAVDYIKSQQDATGAWWGRWGVNYLYGTWQVLMGLRAVGEDFSLPYIQKSGTWLKSVQMADGSFGETCATYDDPSLKGTGHSTASQTAWAAMALMAIYGPHDAAVTKALSWLATTQQDNGDWHEPWFTGTGFPKVFYLRYHFYRLYFPLMALGRYQRLTEKA
jgi:squalene-hopene/tetraprenyl-beta-curcumene cyclase